LDQRLEKLNISSYGVGITTLEEVFLQVGKSEDEEEEEIRDSEWNEDGSPRSSLQLSPKSTIQKSPIPSVESRQMIEEEFKEDLEAKGEEKKEEDLQKSSLTTPLKANGTADQNQSSTVKRLAKEFRPEIENYTIVEQQEQGQFNVFWIQFNALLKKKILMQLRDLRTMVIEVFFPIILIVCGLALTTLLIQTDSDSRALSPELFGLTYLMYNYNGTLTSGTDPESFIAEYFDDTSLFEVL